LAFNVESVESVKAYLLSQGVDVEQSRVDEYTTRKFTFFVDPDGLPLEQYKQANIYTSQSRNLIKPF
jgi:glyoxylase I family protein